MSKSKACKHCNSVLSVNEAQDIRWRLEFLAAAAGKVYELPINETESCGFMCLLNDVAKMIFPVPKDEEAVES